MSDASVYFGNVRTQIEPLLAERAERVLEIGCSSGETLRWLKATGRAGRAWGIELFEPAAQAARAHAEEVLVGNAETLIDSAFGSDRYELILCLDVLEHMVDPWRFVDTLQHRLAPGGRLVISVPNIRCIKVLLPLVLLGRFRYQEHGILDRTHLRFFTRESALALAAPSQLEVERWLRYMPPNFSKLGLANLLTLGLARDLIATQYLIASTHKG
jgi:2-polyprenyl-3-methyl-5-hydroxy-6-metoxy-1,4-benzoquinol methylase